MFCEICQNTESEVLDSRYNPDRTVIRRRRECKNCGYRWTTKEEYSESRYDMELKKIHTAFNNLSKRIENLKR